MPMDGCSISEEILSGREVPGEMRHRLMHWRCAWVLAALLLAPAQGVRAEGWAAPDGAVHSDAGRHRRIPTQTGGVHRRTRQIRGRGRRLLELHCRQAPAAPRQASQQSRDGAQRLRAHPAAGLFRTAEADRSLRADRRGAAPKIRARGGRLSGCRGQGIQLRSAAASKRDRIQARLRQSCLRRRADQGPGGAHLRLRSPVATGPTTCRRGWSSPSRARRPSPRRSATTNCWPPTASS